MIKLDRLNTVAGNAGDLIWMEYSDPCNESTEVQNDETMEKLNDYYIIRIRNNLAVRQL